jgi:hypothetical protein
MGLLYFSEMFTNFLSYIVQHISIYRLFGSDHETIVVWLFTFEYPSLNHSLRGASVDNNVDHFWPKC